MNAVGSPGGNEGTARSEVESASFDKLILEASADHHSHAPSHHDHASISIGGHLKSSLHQLNDLPDLQVKGKRRKPQTDHLLEYLENSSNYHLHIWSGVLI